MHWRTSRDPGPRVSQQVFQGRHLHREVAVKVLQLDGGLVHAVQREVCRQIHVHRRLCAHDRTGSLWASLGAELHDSIDAVAC